MNMNARIKLSAREALLGSSLTVLPTLALIIILTVFFSLCAAATQLLPLENPHLACSLVALAALPAALFTLAPLRLKMQQKHIILALGSREARELHFADFLNASMMYSLIFLLKLLWLALYEAIPCVIFAVFAYRISSGPVGVRVSVILLSGITLLAVLGAVFWLITVQRYSRAEFYLAAYGGISAKEAISLSVRKSAGEATKIFLFKLSFLPWLLLCAAVLPSLYIIPYYKQSITCRFLCGR